LSEEDAEAVVEGIDKIIAEQSVPPRVQATAPASMLVQDAACSQEDSGNINNSAVSSPINVPTRPHLSSSHLEGSSLRPSPSLTVIEEQIHVPQETYNQLQHVNSMNSQYFCQDQQNHISHNADLYPSPQFPAGYVPAQPTGVAPATLQHGQDNGQFLGQTAALPAENFIKPINMAQNSYQEQIVHQQNGSEGVAREVKPNETVSSYTQAGQNYNIHRDYYNNNSTEGGAQVPYSGSLENGHYNEQLSTEYCKQQQSLHYSTSEGYFESAHIYPPGSTSSLRQPGNPHPSFVSQKPHSYLLTQSASEATHSSQPLLPQDYIYQGDTCYAVNPSYQVGNTPQVQAYTHFLSQDQLGYCVQSQSGMYSVPNDLQPNAYVSHPYLHPPLVSTYSQLPIQSHQQAQFPASDVVQHIPVAQESSADLQQANQYPQPTQQAYDLATSMPYPPGIAPEIVSGTLVETPVHIQNQSSYSDHQIPTDAESFSAQEPSSDLQQASEYLQPSQQAYNLATSMAYPSSTAPEFVSGTPVEAPVYIQNQISYGDRQTPTDAEKFSRDDVWPQSEAPGQPLNITVLPEEDQRSFQQTHNFPTSPSLQSQPSAEFQPLYARALPELDLNDLPSDGIEIVISQLQNQIELLKLKQLQSQATGLREPHSQLHEEPPLEPTNVGFSKLTTLETSENQGVVRESFIEHQEGGEALAQSQIPETEIPNRPQSSQNCEEERTLLYKQLNHLELLLKDLRDNLFSGLHSTCPLPKMKDDSTIESVSLEPSPKLAAYDALQGSMEEEDKSKVSCPLKTCTSPPPLQPFQMEFSQCHSELSHPPCRCFHFKQDYCRSQDSLRFRNHVYPCYSSPHCRFSKLSYTEQKSQPPTASNKTYSKLYTSYSQPNAGCPSPSIEMDPSLQVPPQFSGFYSRSQPFGPMQENRPGTDFNTAQHNATKPLNKRQKKIPEHRYANYLNNDSAIR
jgi:hypothetical protein